MTTSIPLVDLQAQYKDIKAEIDGAISRVVESMIFYGGNEVACFEQEFAAFCGAAGCVAVANGTDALTLALRALKIGPGDEVITVAHTFIATAEAISAVGANPVFIDIRQDTMLMDPACFEAAITPATRAVIPVHLYGQPCEMDRIRAIARRYNLKIVEDAAQAHGARWQGKTVGTLGDAACFSFYASKNLGAYGDGGAVVSNDADLLLKVRMLGDHGRKPGERYIHDVAGANSRLDALQAAVLRVKLAHLSTWTAARRRHAACYIERLSDTGLALPKVNPQAEPVWHLFAVRTANRGAFQAELAKQGIATGIHYPVPLHLQPAYAHLGLKEGTLPASEQAANEVVSLPMYPELTGEQLARVIAAARDACLTRIGRQ